MSWARLDDKFTFHAKVLAAGNEAVGVFVRMLTYACAHLTDGFVADAAAAAIASGSAGAVERLVAEKLLERVENGYQIHDFHDWNPPGAEVKARRDADRIRKADARRGQGRDKRGRVTSPPRPDGVRADVQPDSARTSTGPVPVPVPVPVPKGEERARSRAPAPAVAKVDARAKAKPATERVTRLPEGWAPSPSTLEWCATKGVDVARTLERFSLYWRAEGGAKAAKRDWDAAFRTWVHRDLDGARAGTTKARPRVQPAPTDGPSAWEITPTTNGAAT